MSTPKPRAKVSLDQPRFYIAEHRIRDGHLVVKLPAEVVEYLSASSKIAQLYYIAVDGTIQLSADIPTLAIPVNRAQSGDFIPHKATKGQAVVPAGNVADAFDEPLIVDGDDD